MIRVRPGDPPNAIKLFVSGLPDHTNVEKLEGLLLLHDVLPYSTVCYRDDHGLSTGIAFITYLDLAIANEAIARARAGSIKVHNQPIKIERARKRASRSTNQRRPKSRGPPKFNRSQVQRALFTSTTEDVDAEQQPQQQQPPSA